MKIFRN